MLDLLVAIVTTKKKKGGTESKRRERREGRIRRKAPLCSRLNSFSLFLVHTQTTARMGIAKVVATDLSRSPYTERVASAR